MNVGLGVFVLVGVGVNVLEGRGETENVGVIVGENV